MTGKIEKGAVSKKDYLRTLEENILPELERGLPRPVSGKEAFIQAASARVLAALYSNSESRFYRDKEVLEASCRYANQATKWYQDTGYPGHPGDAIDFASISLYKFLRSVGEEIPGEVKENITGFIKVCADTCHYGGGYINHNLNTALVCEYFYNLTGQEEYHRACKAKTSSSLHFFDRSDGRNPEVAQNYGMYGIILLVEIASECEDNDPEFAERLRPYIEASVETLPTYYFYEETGDFMAIHGRETVKIVGFSAPVWCIEGFEICADYLGDGRYRSLARFVYDHWRDRFFKDGKSMSFPRWERNDDLAPVHLKRIRIADVRGAAAAFPALALSDILECQSDVEPAEFIIRDKIVGKYSFQRKKTKSALGVISNVLYSPVAYMTKGGACVVGETFNGSAKEGDISPYFAFRLALDYRNSRLTFVDTDDFFSASAYSRTHDVYSTSFFHKGCLLWFLSHRMRFRREKGLGGPRAEGGSQALSVETAVVKPDKVWCDLFAYYNKELPMWFRGDTIQSDAPGSSHKGLRWVLLANGDDEFLAIALLGGEATTLSTKKGAVTIEYGAAEDSEAMCSSVLLVRQWFGAPEAFQQWLDKWVVMGDGQWWQTRTPEHNIYFVEHRNQIARGTKISEPSTKKREVRDLRKTLIYEDDFVKDRGDWQLEGLGKIEYSEKGLYIEGNQCPTEEQKGQGAVVWNKRDFEGDLLIEYEVHPVSEKGLCIVFFHARGTEGEDILAELPPRGGDFGQYVNGRISTYHISYFRNGPAGKKTGLCNLCKNPGHHSLYKADRDPTPDTNRSYQVRLTKRGTNIVFEVDGSKYIDYTDDESHGPVLTGGKIGLRVMPYTQVYYRKLRVYSMD